MKITMYLLVVALTAFSTVAHAARISDACTSNSECSRDGQLTCVASNCVEAGKLTITLAWHADTDLDLTLETPSGGRIGALDEERADGGRLTIDECYDAERCGSSEHPHVEHIVWEFDEQAPTGRYRLEIVNFDGRSAAAFEIFVTRPDGRSVTLSGAVAGIEGATDDASFVVEKSESCSDRDLDGLCDDWESAGIDGDGDGEVDLVLEGASVGRKDLFVEIDWMPGAKPYPLDAVVDAFADAPVDNPDGSHGITLHLEISDEIDEIDGQSIGQKYEFADKKMGVAKFGKRRFGEDSSSCVTGWFGSASDRTSANCEAIIAAKKKTFRYALFAYKRKGTTSSGRGELPGNDLIVSSKSWRSNNQDLENATFMHELGHTLGLYHGGGDGHNCKPNYLSLMSYFYQTRATWAGRPLDYSRQRLPTIDEKALIEFNGIAGPNSWEQVAFHGPDGSLIVTDTDASVSIDWNQNGDINVDVVESQISKGEECAQSGVPRKLKSHDDWSALIYNFRLTDKYGVAWGDDEPVEELTEEQYERMARASDSDVDGFDNLVDNCPSVANEDQSDRDEDDVGDACDACPEDAAAGYTDGCRPHTLDAQDETAKRPREIGDVGFVESAGGCSTASAGPRLLYPWFALLFIVLRRSRRR